MQFSRTFIVEDSEPMVSFQLGQLLRGAGYKLLPDGRYQRGTREASLMSFDPSKWFTRIVAVTSSTPDFYTQVVLSYDVQTAGQSLKYHIRKFWIDEINQFVASLGGRIDEDQDRMAQTLGLNWSPGNDDPLTTKDVSTAGQMVLTPVHSALPDRYDQQKKNGANWFFWIAGLSLVNSVIYILDANLSFIVGLGATQVVDVFASSFIAEIPEGLAFFRVVALLVNLAILAIFVGFGLLARKGKPWAFLVGMALYLLDGLLYVWIADWFAVAFHGIALYGLLRGYLACRELRKLKTDSTVLGQFTRYQP